MVIGLCGDLGAGKTQLVKGFARGLVVPESVHSPTYALVNVYSGGRLPLFHLDLYRLETTEQILGAGLEEFLHPAGVSIIEWADRWFSPTPVNSPLPCRRLRWVVMETMSETERRIIHEDFGA